MSKRNVVHIEIPAEDIQSAAKFYETLFGWKMQHDDQFDYTMWADGSGYGGGFNKVSEENPADRIVVYIHSDNIEADLKKVEELGGSVVVPKTEIPGTGWFAQFKDPAGNLLALYTSTNPDFNQ